MLKNVTFSSNTLPGIVIIPLIMLMMASCGQPKKMISSGNYDGAIDLLVEKNLNRPTTNSVLQLEQAFHLANSGDLNDIQNLKTSGQPDIWLEVYEIYAQIAKRQEKMAMLPNDVLTSIGFTRTDYTSDLENAREKAALYHYALAQKQLSAGNEGAHSEAVDNLQKIQAIYPGFRDVEELLGRFNMVNPIKVFYAIENKFQGTLPPGVGGDLQRLDLSEFDRPKYRFVSERPDGDEFQVYAEIRLTNVKISPAKTGELSYTESVEIQDGLAYQLDEAGDFVLDSTGQKIEIPRFETLVCYVTEYKQLKSMKLLGEVEIFDRNSGKTIGYRQLTGEAKFEHLYAKFKGDLDALSPESKTLIGTKEKEFPTDGQLIMFAGMRMVEDASKKIAEVLDNVDLK
jgi:hypothetical protein